MVTQHTGRLVSALYQISPGVLDFMEICSFIHIDLFSDSASKEVGHKAGVLSWS